MLFHKGGTWSQPSQCLFFCCFVLLGSPTVIKMERRTGSYFRYCDFLSLESGVLAVMPWCCKMEGGGCGTFPKVGGPCTCNRSLL